MKLKILLLSALFCLIQFSPSYAKRYGAHLPRAPKYGSYGRSHSIRPYFKKNGSFVQGHRASNPRSGMRCHNNICY